MKLDMLNLMSSSQSKEIYADNDYTFRAGIRFDLNPSSEIRLEYNNSDFDRKSYGRWADTHYSEVRGFKLNSKHKVTLIILHFLDLRQNLKNTLVPMDQVMTIVFLK